MLSQLQLRVMTTRGETDIVTVHKLHNECTSEAVRPSLTAYLPITTAKLEEIQQATIF